MTTLTRSTAPALCIVLAALAIGCYSVHKAAEAINAEKAPAPASTRNLYTMIDPIYVYADPDTGCQYLMREERSSAIAQRIAADGKTHMGCGVKP